MDKVIHEWNKAASLYAKSQETSMGSVFCRNFVNKHFSAIDNLRVLDAGCGSGEYTHILANNGGIVTSCDASIEMLNIAREKYPLNKYDNVNLLENLPYNNNSFDIIFCNLVLMDINPIDNVISEFYRIADKNGIFFFSIVHPAFYLGEWEKSENGDVLSKKVSEYITPVSEQQEFWGKTMHYHRPISYYLNKAAETGFIFNKMIEPQVYEDINIPDIPLYMFVEFRK